MEGKFESSYFENKSISTIVNMAKINRQYDWLLPEGYDGENVVEAVLRRRFGAGFDMESFLSPQFVLADPFLMKGVKEAIFRLQKAFDKREKICVYGDYDTDGLTASALMYELLDWLGFEVEVFIPNRYDYGYGLKQENLKKIKADVILTVDCGIRAKSVIDLMNKFEYIVTDHHQVGDELPDCVAVINPHQNDCDYPFKELSGVGVAYVLARGLLQQWKIEAERADWWLKWNLDLVALGTVADMMPLVGENRVLVKYGLKVMEKRRRIGLDRMLMTAGKKNDSITSFDLGFLLGPRLNAVGRLGSARIGWEILVTKDSIRAGQLALELNQINQQRRGEVDRITKQVLQQADLSEKVIMAAGEGWLRGVVGLVAGRMADKYNRPVFLAEWEEDNLIGSVRGVAGVNVEQMLSKTAEYLDNFGGHEQAGGFSLAKENWDDFQLSIRGLMEEFSFDKKKLVEVDYQVQANQVKMAWWDSIKKLHPLGVGNPEPVMMLKDVPVVSQRIIGKNKDHAKFVVDLAGQEIEALFWGAGERLIGTNINQMNLLGNLQENFFNNQINKVVNIIDLEVSDG